ncbi:response regulator transcription factor [Bordetella genomosp. 12]|uniref:DNA-binding response regulator n=1 Tax=Bordetella genomosp. 12 TaxID=463035 RepID=A0A261VBM7_9BORD|nr:response regulator transcription factor [Bordetella genomosp. 12]OZI71556.1 DNA-binding response regulator [Bordetella genomosp. 12]
MRILLIDDDVELTTMLSQYLTHEGFEVVACSDGERAIGELARRPYSLAVLDIMMPGLSGLETLQRIRLQHRLPVLMLTARGDDIDKVIGLNLGADDYVAKPCSPAELLARIRAILRRTQGAALADTPTAAAQEAPRCLKAGPLELWPGSRQATWHGEPLELTGTEFMLLEVLARHVGTLVSKQVISMEAFSRPLTPFDRRIDVHISAIRQKLGHRPDGQPWIQNVRGQGYQFLEA